VHAGLPTAGTQAAMQNRKLVKLVNDVNRDENTVSAADKHSKQY
jgi:hypothetical protein